MMALPPWAFIPLEKDPVQLIKWTSVSYLDAQHTCTKVWAGAWPFSLQGPTNEFSMMVTPSDSPAKGIMVPIVPV